ncbi:DUF4427 domain-containing protein [Candidatus Saccharibacteria bacterium]|nr:DUF4427 domain-containing protein [Candidatus Saccharibacteria bacterium]
MLNNERYDLSDKLIHFFRSIDPEDGSMPASLGDWGFNNIEEGGVLQPLFLLRVCIRYSVLWSTWSFRNGVRTIYGSDPAVCFTDMPLAAFFETSQKRGHKGEKISPYALFFDKKQMFQNGARPVIYGLSNECFYLPSGKDGGPRIIDEKILPLSEQYRFVAYNPNAQPSIDWTHEREWRLPNRNSTSFYEKEIKKYGCVEGPLFVPGMDLTSNLINDIGIIVKSKEEKEQILYDILSLIHRKEISPQKYGYIICYDDIENIDTIKNHNEQKKLIELSKINYNQFLNQNSILATETIKKICDMEKQIDTDTEFAHVDNVGKCWLWMYDFFDKKVQAMLNEGDLKVNKYGKILYKPKYISNRRDLGQQENMIEELAKHVKTELGIECGYMSVAYTGKSYDMDSLPYFNSQDLSKRLDKLYYNYNDVD